MSCGESSGPLRVRYLNCSCHIYQQVGSAKSVEKDVKVLKSKLSDEGVVIKSLEAKLVELQSKGGHCLIRFQLFSYLR